VEQYGGTVGNSGNATTTFTSCMFLKNRAQSGGGIVQNQGSSIISNCIFSGNSAETEGGAVWGSNLTITNSVFSDNFAVRGGAVFSVGRTSILNSTIFKSSPDTLSAGIGFRYFGNQRAEIRNSILWIPQNDLTISGSETDTLAISYSDLLHGTDGISPIGPLILEIGSGNISAYPSFLNSGNPAGADSAFFSSDDGLNLFGGPCRNTGDPNSNDLPLTDIVGSPRVQGGRVDMGAYEQ
jgi:predicted outer membrane repeat protein